MNDVFLLSRSAVDAAEVALMGEAAGCGIAQIGADASTVVSATTARVLWSFAPLDVMDLPQEERDFLRQRRVRVVLCVSYHGGEIDVLRRFAEVLLRRFGGWIGSDDDFFEPLFDVDTIGALGGENL